MTLNWREGHDVHELRPPLVCWICGGRTSSRASALAFPVRHGGLRPNADG
jgi:hypothetical protein